MCIAADFTKYDGHAVQQINRNIGLIRYRRFGDELLLFELANAVTAAPARGKAAKAGKQVDEAGAQGVKPTGPDKSYAEIAASLPEGLQVLLASLEDHVLSLGDDVQRKELRLYTAFKRLKNFATVVLQRHRLLLYLHVDPAAAVASLANARDVSAIGHWGTGDLELALSTLGDLDRVKPFIAAAYEGRTGRANAP